MSESFSTFLHSATPNYSCLNSLLASKLTAIPSIPQPYCSICTHCNHLLTNFNHHPPGNAAEEGTSKLGTGLNVKSHQQSSSSSSTRWSPTPIQLLVLEELYRQGTKTPSAEQIQQIASQLRQFGKIEGKNVFYWFQNHKARERQKRRRREMEEDNTTTAPPPSSTQGLKETGCEVKETKKWASTSNCSGHAEESAALDRAEKGSNGWTTQFEEIRGIQALRRSNNMHHHHHANKCQHMEIAPFPSIAIASPPTSVASHRTSNKHPLGTPQNYILSSVLNRESFINYDDDEENADPRTLELFPVKSSDGICFSERKSNYNKFCANGASMEDISCNQFFEFLPLRN